jgi:hypothetical protein
MRRILALLVFVCLPFLHLNAQSTTVSQLSGTVVDQTGAAVASAQVQVTNVDTNGTRITQTSDAGAFTFQNLDIGTYRLDVTATGFAKYEQTGITLEVNTNPSVLVSLKVGAVTQTVEVQANTAMVETQTNGIGQVIQPEQVVDLPLNGRQATQLILLAGGATPGASGGTINTLDYPSAVQVSMAGSTGANTAYYLDGALNMDLRTNVGLPMPFPDALQEFSVESSAMPASAGGRPGGAVNAAVKSGTNSVHGDVFEFLRNGLLDADTRTWVSSTGTLPKAIRDNLKQNQFGGTVGGPIIRNKIFFFTGFQGTTQRQQSTPSTATVPTAATLSGNFSQVLSTACSSRQGYLNNTFATAPLSNQLQPQFLTGPSAAIASKILNYLPPPNDPGIINATCGTYEYSPLTHNNEFQGVLRTDWQHTQNDSVFFRYFVTNYYSEPFVQKDSLTPSGISLFGASIGLADQAQSVDIGDTHILSPRTINVLRLSFERTATVRTSTSGIPTIQQLGCACTSQLGNNISVYASAPGFEGWDYENTFGVSEMLEYSVHSHQLSMGFDFERVQMNGDGVFQLNPSMGFGSNDTWTSGVDTSVTSVTGSSLADFLTGNADSYSQGNGQLSRDQQNQPSFFVQDNWKVSRRFQVNGGLRWGPFLPQWNKYGEASDFSFVGFLDGAKSHTYPNAPPGVTFPGDTGFHGKSDTNNHIWDFSPRVGFVWDPKGDGRQTIRAGYGVFYDTSILWNTMHIVLNPPWGETLSFTPATVAEGGGLANPWATYPGGNPFPTPLNPPSDFVFPIGGSYVFQNQNIKPDNVQQWNLAIQKQVGANWLLSVSYIGNKTSHLWLGHNQDYTQYLSQYGSGSCTLPFLGQNLTWTKCNDNSSQDKKTITLANGLPYSVSNYAARNVLNMANPTNGPYFGSDLQEFSDGNAIYNGLLLSAQHRLSQNFSIQSNFTWSHCMDDGEEGQDLGSSGNNPAIPKDWGNCGSDERKVLNVSVVVRSPNRGARLVRAIIGGWNGSGIFTAHTGGFTNISDGTDIAHTGGGERPNQVGNPFQAGNIGANSGCVGPTQVHTVAHWFNPCAFVDEAVGTYGDEVRNTLPLPGAWNLDTAVWKTFPIGERFKTEFRAEAFNVFNHSNWGGPSTTLTSTTDGFISSGSGPRIMQVALKVTF